MASCVIASSVPSAFAPSSMRWIIAGPVAERVHLLPRQHEAHRALAARAPPAPPAPPDIADAGRSRTRRRHNGDMTRTSSGFMLEHAAQIALHVLHALGLVVDRELAVAVPDHGRGEQLHRIVMLDRNVIFGLMAHGGRGQRLRGIAARLWRGCSSGEGAASRCAIEIRDVRLPLRIRRAPARRRIARSPNPRPAPARSAAR